MTDKKIQKAKDFFLSTLPDKLLAALKAYDDFTKQAAPMEAKSFGAYHVACKGALTHIGLLIKMLQLTSPSTSSTSCDLPDEASMWLTKAEQALGTGEGQTFDDLGDDENDET